MSRRRIFVVLVAALRKPQVATSTAKSSGSFASSSSRWIPGGCSSGDGVSWRRINFDVSFWRSQIAAPDVAAERAWGHCRLTMSDSLAEGHTHGASWRKVIGTLATAVSAPPCLTYILAALTSNKYDQTPTAGRPPSSQDFSFAFLASACVACSSRSVSSHKGVALGQSVWRMHHQQATDGWAAKEAVAGKRANDEVL